MTGAFWTELQGQLLLDDKAWGAHRIQEGIMEADFVEILAAKYSSGQHRICDTHNLQSARQLIRGELALSEGSAL